MQVALINSNRSRPPVAPLGLDYLAEHLTSQGHRVHLLDLCWAADWRASLETFLAAHEFQVIGLSLRNTDDCMMSGGHSYLAEFQDLIRAIRAQSQATVVVGGAGFSVLAEQVLARSGADFGIRGDGEFPFARLLDAWTNGLPLDDLPQLVYRRDGRWRRGRAGDFPLADLPLMSRTWIDNERYFAEGGQAGFETHRGCPERCVYCADPVAKGHRVRRRPPEAVAAEVTNLADRGITHLHTCDAEFNIPLDHALAICAEFRRHGLDRRCCWYAYCAPVPFPPELAISMREAGCVGINFGADHVDPAMLRRLGRRHQAQDLVAAVELCRREGIATMVDLLLGGPGETEESLRDAVHAMGRLGPDCIGLSLGLRIYPGTPLAADLGREDGPPGVSGNPLSGEPAYFLEPAIADAADPLLRELVADDPRFFYASCGSDRDYNYTENRLLEEAIRGGMRGAYWDILRRLRS